MEMKAMNSTEGAPLQAAGYHRHSVEILPVGPRRKRRGIAQLAMKAGLETYLNGDSEKVADNFFSIGI
ncbi:MAG: hypothetical protein WCY41_06370 [Candidatus Micrarchaeia archaeon]